MSWVSENVGAVLGGAGGGVAGGLLGGPWGAVAGGLLGLGSGLGAQGDARAIREANERQLAYEREFAQSGIQWRVADARAAGINPLAALGAVVPGYSGTVMPEGKRSTVVGSVLRDMGQNISRAAMSAQTKEVREMAAMENAMRLERLALENQLLATQVHEAQNPSFPVVSEAQVVANPFFPGEYSVVPSMEMGMASQGDYVAPLSFRIKHGVTPWMINMGKRLGRGLGISSEDIGLDPKQFPLPKGYDRWKMLGNGRWIPVKSFNVKE